MHVANTVDAFREDASTIRVSLEIVGRAHFRIGWVWPLAVVLACTAFFFPREALSQASMDGLASQTRWEKRIDTLVVSLPGFFDLRTHPTEPVPQVRAIAEWEPVNAIAVGIRLKQALADRAIFEYYQSVMEAAGQYVDIVILYAPQDAKLVDLFLKRLEEAGLAQSILERTNFALCDASDFWVRDHGPLFGISDTGELIVFDNSGRKLVAEKEAFYSLPQDFINIDSEMEQESYERYLLRNRNRETTPLFLAKFIRQNYFSNCETIRPPLYLQGGDYSTDGNGRFFVSDDTVLGNDGRLSYLKDVLRDYYGASEVHVLNALPRTNVKHLDMLMKLVSEDTMLLAEATPEIVENSKSQRARILRELEKIYAANESYVRKRLPNLKLLKLPMLPPLTENVDTVKRRVRSEIAAKICQEIGISYQRYSELLPNDPQKKLVRDKINVYLEKRHGSAFSLWVDKDLDFLAEAHLGLDLNTILATHTDLNTVYRSYLNSVFIKTREGREAWLLPRYKARAGEVEEEVELIERRVETLYRTVSPEAKLHWIDSDVMVDSYGAIHCSVVTLPDISGYEE